jgi:hypothetical protein
MLNPRRQTRATVQASRTCYDRFSLGILTSEKDLCAHCFDYNAIVIKKKPQQDMGRRFQCRWPQEGAQLLEVELLRSRKPDQGRAASNPVPETEHHSQSQPKRAHPYHFKNACARLEKELEEAKQNLRESKSKNNELEMECCSLEVGKATELESFQAENARLLAEINNLKEVVEQMKLEVIDAERKASRSSTGERKAYAQLSNLQKSRGSKCDPVHSCISLIKVLSGAGISEAEIVKGFLSALCEKKKTRKHIVSALLESIVGENIKADVEVAFYKSIQEKFAPWKCLLHLDLEASVSFRGLNIIRKIEFYGEEKVKYRRGIIQERTKLSRIARELEIYGKNFLPYDLTKTSVRFDIKKATTYLLKKFELWDHVKGHEKVLLAATVDGGQLAWKLTQISAGVKMVDERSINP